MSNLFNEVTKSIMIIIIIIAIIITVIIILVIVIDSPKRLCRK